MIALKLILNKWFKVVKMANMLDSKVMKGNKIIVYDLCRFWKYFRARRRC